MFWFLILHFLILMSTNKIDVIFLDLSVFMSVCWEYTSSNLLMMTLLHKINLYFQSLRYNSYKSVWKVFCSHVEVSKRTRFFQFFFFFLICERTMVNILILDYFIY